MTVFYEPSRELREWISLGACAVDASDVARELAEMLEDHAALADGFNGLAEKLAQRDLEPPEGEGQHNHVCALLDTLAAARDAFEPHEFNLVTGESASDAETPSGPSRLQAFLAMHDELVKFRHRVAKLLDPYGPMDDDRTVKMLEMLLP